VLTSPGAGANAYWTSNVTVNNANYLATVLASSYANTTNTSATNITTGTLPWAQAPSGTVNTSGNFTLAGNTTYSANIILSSAASEIILEGGYGAGGNVIVNSTAVFFGNSGTNASINSTVYSGSANNASYLGTTIASSYASTSNTSATNITAGTLPWAQAPSGTVNTSSTPTFTTGVNIGANTLLTTTSITVQNTAAAYAGNIAINATTIFLGNTTVNSVINSTVYSGSANNA